MVAAVDAVMTVLLSLVFVQYWGLKGGADATVIAALVAAMASFAIAFSRFGLTLPLEHLAPLATATAIMTAIINIFPEAPSLVVLAAHVALGGAVYVAALGVFYAPSLLRMFRLRHRQSEL
jgi:hypothetical protein